MAPPSTPTLPGRHDRHPTIAVRSDHHCLHESGALPTVGREVHTSTIERQWVTGAYSVVFGALMLLFGAVADRFGRRRVMLVGLLLPFLVLVRAHNPGTLDWLFLV